MNTKLIPLTRRETRVYLPNVAGGFDLSGCPDAEILAALIVKAVNAHDQLVEALIWARSTLGNSSPCAKACDAALFAAGVKFAAAEGK